MDSQTYTAVFVCVSDSSTAGKGASRPLQAGMGLPGVDNDDKERCFELSLNV
jgi:hypothetical protein